MTLAQRARLVERDIFGGLIGALSRWSAVVSLFWLSIFTSTL